MPDVVFVFVHVYIERHICGYIQLTGYSTWLLVCVELLMYSVKGGKVLKVVKVVLTDW